MGSVGRRRLGHIHWHRSRDHSGTGYHYRCDPDASEGSVVVGSMRVAADDVSASEFRCSTSLINPRSALPPRQ